MALREVFKRLWPIMIKPALGKPYGTNICGIMEAWVVARTAELGQLLVEKLVRGQQVADKLGNSSRIVN